MLMSCNRASHLTVIILLNIIMLLRLPSIIPVFLPSISLTFENAYLRRGNIQALMAIPRSRSYSIAIHHSPTALQPYCFSLEVEIGLPFKIFSFRYWKESISIMLIGYTLYNTSGHPSAQPLLCQVLQSLGSYWLSKPIVLQAALNAQRLSSLYISVGTC